MTLHDRPDLTVIILTFNEEIHIRRCLESVAQVARKVFIVDSLSTDRTREIAQSMGAVVFEHPFKNYSDQFSWALNNLPIDSGWVMRVDADETISSDLAADIVRCLLNPQAGISAYLVSLYYRYQGAFIRHGGMPLWQLRLWNRGKVTIEQRWMDEHMVLLEGRSERLRGEYVDDNLNNVTWWTTKHNAYATREAIDLLNRRHGFLALPEVSGTLARQARIKRWMKEQVYGRLPPGLRAFLYFVYRMVFRLGVLDGADGFAFHFLQGFWYRFLVDVKVREVERRMKKDGIPALEAIRREFGIDPTV